MEKSSKDNLFIECGVFEGESINLFAKKLLEKNYYIHGFDSFEGFDDNWPGSALEKIFLIKKVDCPKLSLM